MKQNKPVKKSLVNLDRWSGINTTLLVLAIIVIALVVLVLRLPATSGLQLTATLTPTAAPVINGGTPTVVSEILPPPIVDTTGVVVMGGMLVLLVLGIVLRELAWFRRQP